jgi:hypothetical protein
LEKREEKDCILENAQTMVLIQVHPAFCFLALLGQRRSLGKSVVFLCSGNISCSPVCKDVLKNEQAEFVSNSVYWWQPRSQWNFPRTPLSCLHLFSGLLLPIFVGT